MINHEFYAPLALACEAAGYHSMVVPDSICYPQYSDSKYPFSPDGNREFLEDKPFIDPFVLISALGMVTKRLTFTTFVLKLPVRHPVLVAKQAMSCAVMTDNRLLLGLGVSPWPDDYEICDISFRTRGKRMNESIEVLTGLFSGEYFEYHGEIFDIPSIKMAPAPTQEIPILVGGHANAALERAAKHGDGWLHGGGDLSELPNLLSKLNEYRKRYDRDSKQFQIFVISPDAWSLDGIRRLEDQGVTDVIVGFRWPYTKQADHESLADKLSNLNRFAEDIISKVSP